MADEFEGHCKLRTVPRASVKLEQGGVAKTSMTPLQQTMLAFIVAFIGCARIVQGQVSLIPESIAVVVGQSATFACSPFIPGAQPVLQIQRPGDNNFGNIDPLTDSQLTVIMDYPFGSFDPSNRTYQYQSLRQEENGTRFLCIITGIPSNVAILTVTSATLELNFVNDSPRVEGNNISADIQTSRAVFRMRCALTGLPYQDCSSGSITFNNVPPREGGRPYILRAEAKTADGVRTVIRRAVRIEEPNICTVHLINTGITSPDNSGSTIVEFANTGPAETFLCSVDRQALSPCTSPFTISGLSPGQHLMKIVPRNCGRNRRPKAVRFIIGGETI